MVSNSCSISPQEMSPLVYSTNSSTLSNLSHDDQMAADQAYAKKFLLTLDGGGVRGYSTLLILQRLMQLCGGLESAENVAATSSYHPIPFQISQGTSVGRNDQTRAARYLPAHYFDYIAGTSTGGLIAIMLGRLRMSVDDCLEEFENMGKEIFGRPRMCSMRGPIPANREKYSAENLQKAFQKVIKTRSKVDEDAIGVPMFPSTDGLCRTLVITVRDQDRVEAPYLCRSYHHPRPPNPADKMGVVHNPGGAANVPIWQVARATTAAPTYFKPMTIGPDRFLDGGFGVGANNPSWYTFFEVSQMHNNNEQAVALTLSIGTGIPTKLRAFSKGNGLFEKLKTIILYAAATATDSETTHRHMLQMSKTYGGRPYVRFNVEGGLGDIDLGEWKIQKLNDSKPAINVTLATIREKTEEYLDKEETKLNLTSVARMLVANRQIRSKDRLRWDLVATGHRYHCIIDKCPASTIYHSSEDSLVHHLVYDHADMGFKHPTDPGTTDEGREDLKRTILAGKILHAD